MKVSDLISRLEECDPDAEVYIMQQPSWPFENSISGITTREELLRADKEEEDWEDSDDPEDVDSLGAENPAYALPWRDRWGARSYELPHSDVFIVEGSQTRYGDKNAWNLV